MLNITRNHNTLSYSRYIIRHSCQTSSPSLRFCSVCVYESQIHSRWIFFHFELRGFCLTGWGGLWKLFISAPPDQDLYSPPQNGMGPFNLTSTSCSGAPLIQYQIWIKWEIECWQHLVHMRTEDQHTVALLLPCPHCSCSAEFAQFDLILAIFIRPFCCIWQHSEYFSLNKFSYSCQE